MASKMLVKGSDDDFLDVSCWNAGHRSDLRCLGLSTQAWQRHVIAIPNAGLGRMRRRHAVTRVIEQQSVQRMVACIADAGPGGPLIRKLLLNRIEQGALHDRGLFAGQDVALIPDLTDIEAIAQEIEQRSPLEWDATAGAAGC